MNFRVGQKVVYIGARPGKSRNYPPDHKPLEKGQIYTVAGFCHVAHRDGNVGIFLCETATYREPGWCDCFEPSRFRPVVERKTDISIFTEMLGPQRELVSVSSHDRQAEPRSMSDKYRSGE